jgi:hypothetical protein
MEKMRIQDIWDLSKPNMEDSLHRARLLECDAWIQIPDSIFRISDKSQDAEMAPCFAWSEI